MAQIQTWRAAQDVIDAEANVAATREAAANGARSYEYEPVARAIARHERVVAAMRDVLAQLVGAEQVDAVVAERRAAVAAMVW